MPHAPAAEEPRSPATPRIRVNALWNIAGLVGDAALALLILPFTIRTLGDTHYGLWVLIGSLTGAFGLLDLGIRGALGRQLAFHRAERNWDEVNATLNTALGLLGIACLLALLGVGLLQLLFFALFEVSADQVLSVRIALAIAGLRLALSFPLNAFDATLWAAERFDRMNQVDLLVHTAAVVAIYATLTPTNGLLALPLIGLVSLVCGGLLKARVTWGFYQQLSLGFRYFRRSTLRTIFSFGLWNAAGGISRQLSMRVPVIVIGAFVAPAAVTPYAIAERVLAIFHGFFNAVSGVVIPRIAAYSAEQDTTRQHFVFLFGGRIVAALACLAGAGVAVFAEDLIRLWMGPEQTLAAVYLTVLTLGLVMMFSQAVTGSLLIGMARHRVLSVIGMVQWLLSGVAAVLAAYYSGALAVAVSVAVIASLAGLAKWINGCVALSIGLPTYAHRVLLPAVLTASIPYLIWQGLSPAPPQTITSLLIQVAGFCLAFAVPFYGLCIRPLKSGLRGWRKKQPRPAQSPSSEP